MKNKIVFGSWEAITVLINLIFAQAFLTFPRDMAYFGGSAGWMIPIVMTAAILIYFAIMTAFYERIGSLDLLDICERAGGRVLKVICGLVIMLFLVAYSAVALGGFSQTLKIVSLDKSPLRFVELIFFAGIVASAYFGIEAVVRINAILIPLVVIGFLLITLGIIPKFHINNLFPVLGNGYMSIARGSLYKLSVFSPLLIFFFMVPFFKKRYIKRVGYLSIIISGVLLLWSTLSFLLLFPYHIAADKRIPVFQMAKHIEFGSFIQRIESIFVLICSVSSLLYLSILFTFTIHVVKKTLGLKKIKPVILSMAVIVFSLADILKRMNLDIISTGGSNFIWLAGLLPPAVILIIGAAKKVKEKDTEGGRQDG